VKLVLQVQRDGYVIASTAGDRIEIPARGGALDVAALERALGERRAREPERRRFVVAAAEDVPYGEAVRAMDLLLSHGFDQVSLSGSPTSGVLGSLSKEAIRRVIRRHIDEVRVCYDAAMTSSGVHFEGRVSVRFIIGPRGAVEEADVVADDTGDPSVGTCIRDAVDGWSFPSPEGGGIVVVTYPFVLQTVDAPE
jgi:hypothetical protein